MKQSRKLLFVVVLCSLLPSAVAQESSSEVDRIESAFLSANDLVIVNRIEDLPGDVIDLFQSSARWGTMANWGEFWNGGDVVVGDEKRRQHVFSAISESVAAVVFQSGGIAGGSVNLLVGERRVPGICRYFLGTGLPHEMESLREAMGEPTFRWFGEVISCRYQP